MLLLTLVVGIGIFIPIPEKEYYFFCAAVEVLVATCADLIDCAASNMVVLLALLMVVIHFTAFVMIGSRIDCPYHNLIVACEYLEIIACILFANGILGEMHARISRIS